MLEEPAAFPMKRVEAFGPPPGVVAVQNGEGLARVRLWDGSTPWLVTGYEEVRRLLADPRASADVDLPGYPDVSAGISAGKRAAKSFINMDNPRHDEIRRLLTPFFTIKIIEAMRPRVQEIVDRFIDEMLAGPNSTDMVKALSQPIPAYVLCEKLGVPEAERAQFNDLIRTISSREASPDELLSAQQEILDFLGNLVDDKNASPGDDMVSRLVVDNLRTGIISREDLVRMLRLVMAAGIDTTTNMMSLGVIALLTQPTVLAEVRSFEEPRLLANTVDELLRWITSVHTGARRVALEDIEVNGVMIAAGEGMVIALDAANRDAAAFPNPDELDIHRRSRHHVAFGYGIHQCLGQPIARVELQILYSTLFRRIPSLRLGTELASIEFDNDSLTYGVHELPITWDEEGAQ